MSLIPDSVKETFGDLLNIYSEVEKLKMQKRLLDAQLSLSSVGQPTYMQDAQAKAQSISANQAPAISGGVMVALGLAAAAALYLIVKK